MVIWNDFTLFWPSTYVTATQQRSNKQQEDNQILWFSAYFPHNEHEVLCGICARPVQYTKGKEMMIIAVCDVNVHHICWRSSNMEYERVEIIRISRNLGIDPTWAPELRSLSGEKITQMIRSCSFNTPKRGEREALKKDIRTAKRPSWRGFCEETNLLQATSKSKWMLAKECRQ